MEHQVSGGESSDTNSSTQGNSQLQSSTPTEGTVEFDENLVDTEDRYAQGDEDADEDASENVDLAISLMEECKAGMSLGNLDTVVFLFRQVMDMWPMTHTLHTDAMRDLSFALGIRFMYTHQINDLQEAFSLRRSIFEDFNPGQGTNSVSEYSMSYESA